MRAYAQPKITSMNMPPRQNLSFQGDIALSRPTPSHLLIRQEEEMYPRNMLINNEVSKMIKRPELKSVKRLNPQPPQVIRVIPPTTLKNLNVAETGMAVPGSYNSHVAPVMPVLEPKARLTGVMPGSSFYKINFSPAMPVNNAKPKLTTSVNIQEKIPSTLKPPQMPTQQYAQKTSAPPSIASNLLQFKTHYAVNPPNVDINKAPILSHVQPRLNESYVV